MRRVARLTLPKHTYETMRPISYHKLLIFVLGMDRAGEGMPNALL
jgi:hypothetical protein